MKSYKLLRSNNISGPYAKEELIEKGLKPYDLIWIEGGSAAWRYASEIEELKAFAPIIEEQPYDRFYKKNKTKPAVISKEERVNESALAATQLQTNLPKIPVEKPRIRIRADWKKIEPPVVITDRGTKTIQEKPSIAAPIAKVVGWEQAWLNWEKEKNSASNASVNASSSIPRHTSESPVLEMKFSDSLESIKERYVEKILDRKNNQPAFRSKNFQSYIFPICLFIVVSGIGFWFGSRHTDFVLKPANNLQANTLPSSVQQTTKTEISSGNNDAIKINDAADNTITSAAKVSPARVENKNVVSENKLTQAKQKLQKSSANTNDVGANAKSFSNNKNFTEHEVASVSSPSVKDEKEKVNVASSPFSSNSKTVDDFVRTEKSIPLSSSASEDVSFHIRNISDVTLDLVVVDLEYYDANGKYRKGESVYLKNVPASKTIPVKIPDDKDAVKVTCKVSLLSSEAKGIYLIAD